MQKKSAQACGILFCYNEEHIIKETLQYYLRQGIDLVVIDNCSTDSSLAIIRNFYADKERYTGKIRDILCFETDGYNWQGMLRKANEYMHQNLKQYEWILLIDADGFYYSPVMGISLLEYMNSVKNYGYNIIYGLVYYFYPTDKDNHSVTSHIERIQHCEVKETHGAQPKIFLYHPSVDFYTDIGHICARDNPRTFANPPFIYKHYVWVSYEQGIRKVFVERKQRYPKWMRFNAEYLHMLPLEKDFVKDSRKLMLYDEKKAQISQWQFFWRNTPEKIFLHRVIRRLKKTPFLPGIFRKPLRLLYQNIKGQVKPPVDARTYNCYPPAEYHFLMTNYCNAKCIFCNQGSFRQPKKTITLDSFKTMVSHIPMKYTKKFHFSGGGDPLLAPDLFPIIRYVNTNFPQIKISITTNGLLIEKHAKDIAETDIDRLTVSVHGAAEINNLILQINSSENIFSGLKLLDRYLQMRNKKIYKVFSAVVSVINIKHIPELIKKAAELKIDEARVHFCRYYSHLTSERLKPEDSLYFYQQLYDSVIDESIGIAKALGVKFTHDPAFLEKTQESSCCQPWCLMLVDWDGDVYPCSGGEVCFEKKVKSGEYHFGNLLNEEVYDFWLNETYVKLRRTCISGYDEKNIPECEICHNTICFKGPKAYYAHILCAEKKCAL